jgi:hypothetical protein
MMLICYDGSNDAKAAIDQAGTLLGGQPALTEVLARTPLGFGFAPGVLNIEEADDACRMAAGRVAEEGGGAGTPGGLQRPGTSPTELTTTADAILSEAEARRG